MIRKHLFIIVIMLPLLSFAQQKRTIMISGDTYHHDLFTGVFHYISTPFHFVERLINRKSNFVNRLHNRLTFSLNNYRFPVISDQENRIILNDKQLIILPRRELLINENRNGILIKRNGHSIYITRERQI